MIGHIVYLLVLLITAVLGLLFGLSYQHRITVSRLFGQVSELDVAETVLVRIIGLTVWAVATMMLGAEFGSGS